MGESKAWEEGRERGSTGPHHIRPSSRGGSDLEDNIYPRELWPPESGKHDLWHILFINMTPEEVIEKLREYMNDKGVLKEEFFATVFVLKGNGHKTKVKAKKKNSSKIPRRKEAWEIVFPNMNGRKAIEWIEREFIRKEWLRQ